MNNLINRIRTLSFSEANDIIRRLSGIVDFFTSETEKAEFISIFENGTEEQKMKYQA